MKDISKTDLQANIPLVSRKDFKREVRAGKVVIGGRELAIMAGPCTVESRTQIFAVAKAVKDAGANLLRGGVFKPLTFPYGDPLGQPDADSGADHPGDRTRILPLTEQLQAAERRYGYFKEAGEKYGLPIVSEITVAQGVSMMSQYVDVFQVGYRHMFNMD
ncbi:MAG: hypothetical protein GY778_32230, partial [bacterium]|nr:hypothetical protein [bacterium]